MKRRGSAQDPLWYKDAIIYETHVKAFFDANQDGIGDFAGLVQKLDYLQELGVTCVWLLPFYPSPLRDDGYDIADYTNIHPSYGTMEDFETFMKAAHERNLQVVTELVVNHTSDIHPWFQAARQSPPGSPERAFYVWNDTVDKYSEARIIFTDTEKSNWTWDAEAKAHYWHRFFSHQPDLNFDNPKVIEEVIRVMKFWFDRGVDGMRLDAIPYLVERPGTNCENLPETHVVLKQIRSALDSEYASRMFLAEANQWPADVRPYFGEGDECHMAFHFPLMPRIFMALRLEDRHPITEILSQTPDIPDICQWGLFLRNHDELTLEMVTNEERDYMYLAYSADPRMRINVGIRRRLAPLMDNNRDRVELMTSLLFSFPGTPIIYYGDEIGMGDNIYLGDRNGVRTPMQWSADRNGGFSRANPARLYSPLIMDPVYGYEAVNVEAQNGDPSSMLNWMRNMIALRKLFKVFGRGTLEFLRPANRKVLAYLRRYESDTILCVANLSRFAQPVEMDLSELAGMVPVEMLGYTEFPPIGRTPYPLTLAPYGFYWFELQGAPAPLEIETVQEAVEEMVSLPADGSWESLLEGDRRSALESKFLPEFLPKQRWFGAKARKIEAVRIRDWAMLGDGAVGSTLSILEVDSAGGETGTYSFPLAMEFGSAAEEIRNTRPEAVVCRLNRGSEVGVLYDATANDETCDALLAAIEQGREFETRNGAIRASATRAYREARGTEESLPVVHGSAEQSNTSILFGDRLILKLFRRIHPGPNPDFEIGKYLTDQGSFERIPQLAGGIEYAQKGMPPATLAMLQALVPNRGDGWKATMEELGRYYEQCATMQDPPPKDVLPGAPWGEMTESTAPPLVQHTVGIYLTEAATLGRRTAELHLALAAASDAPAFAPEPMTASDRDRLSAELREHAARVFDDLKENLARLPDEIVDQAGLVLSHRRQLLERLRKVEEADGGILKIRIHGDYHLGQVLCVENDYVILDFEGEPARSLAERRAKYPALKDVAGMLRSFSYAAYGGLLNYTARRAGDFEKLEGWAELWEKWVSGIFLGAYSKTADGAAFLPADPAQFQQLLEVFLLDKALYELRYEMNNRPAWVRIPLRGILGIIQQS